LILFGVTAGLRREFDWVFRGGLAVEFPAEWTRLCRAVLTGSQTGADVVDATHELLFHDNPEVSARAAYEWCLWESAIPAWPRRTELQPRFRDPAYALAFARIVTHYVRHNAWLKDEALLDGIVTLAGTQTVLIDGRRDPQTTATAEALIERMPLARHVIVDDASHEAVHSGIAWAIIAATDQFGQSVVFR
jgi:proline iminopeptidase